jgi:hypothetical protein
MKITVGAVRFWSWLRGADESDGRQGSFSDDLPIGSLREDLLGRGEFARALATRLTSVSRQGEPCCRSSGRIGIWQDVDKESHRRDAY